MNASSNDRAVRTGQADGDQAKRDALGNATALAVGPDGSLYLATSFGLHTVTPDGTIETDLPDLRDTITRLAVDALGNVYLASADKVQVLVRPRETSTSSWRWIVAGLAILAAVAGGVLVRRRMVNS